MQIIELEFDKNIDSLQGGTMYGHSVYQRQILPKLKNKNDKVIILIPSHIKEISPSFLQGLCLQWILEKNDKILFERVEVASDSQLLQEMIYHIMLRASDDEEINKQFVNATA